jgi:MerR family transcriptional regulator, light-induced transcriptional regulator
MYTIREAAARTGIGAPLIRAWERRYGVVKPIRTPSGYRLYDDETLRVLLAMRALVDSGWTASEAARSITAGEVSVADVTAELPGARRASDVHIGRQRMIDRFAAAAEAASAADTEAALDEIIGSGSYEAVVDDLLLPAMVAVGDAWAVGRLSVAAEHAVSAAVERRLAAAFQAAGVPARTTVVVGLPPSSRHELGALAFAVAVRRRGVGVFYLGADVPVDGWIDAMRRTRARAAVIAIPTEADRETAAAVVDALRAEGTRLIAVGGTAARPPLAEGLLVLPSRVDDAAAALADAVTRRPRGGTRRAS